MPAKTYSINDLNHGRFTPDSTATDSTVKVRQATQPVKPDTELLFGTSYLVNGTHGSDQAQDGSVTPIVYEWEPTQEMLLVSFRMILIGDNITDFFDYGNRIILANGTQIVTVRDTVPTTYATLKQNVDWAQFATESGAGSFEANGNNTQDGQIFVLKYDEPILVSTDFKMQVIINDDLSNLDYHKASVEYQIL